MRFLAFISVAVALLADGHVLGQQSAPAVIKEPDEMTSSFSAYVTTYVVPDFQEYVQPTFIADRGWLHIETRYNYENLKTGSIWLGCNFAGGEKLEWAITPMLGGVFGETMGIAPGYKFSLAYWKLELSSEGEFVFDTNDSEGSFFYNWTELSLSPVDWFRFGLVGQRTRAYQTDVDIQRGLLVGFTYKKIGFTTYVFNLDQSKPTWVFALGVDF